MNEPLDRRPVPSLAARVPSAVAWRVCSGVLLLVVLMTCGGATCNRVQPAIPFPPPPAFALSPTPTPDELAAAINRSASIRQLSTNSATVELLSSPSLPKLKATVHLQRDRDFRLRASLPIVLGSGLDIGSNQDLFWLEVPDGMSKVLYYARHDAYRQQLQRSVLPVDPTWMIDALGLIQIDPTQVIAGPIRRPDGKLEIRSNMPMPDGMYNRVTYIDAAGAYVTDQLLYDPSGQLIAAAEASQHVFYPQPIAVSPGIAGSASPNASPPTPTAPTGADGVVLPHRVKISLAPAGGPPLKMQIEVATYTVNQLLSSDPNLFAIPQTNANSVDLTTLGSISTLGSQPSAYTASVPVGNPLR